MLSVKMVKMISLTPLLLVGFLFLHVVNPVGTGKAARMKTCRTIFTIVTAAPASLAMNDIGEIRLRTAQPLFFDAYARNRLPGSFILIEPGTHATVAAGLLDEPREFVRPEGAEYII